MADSIERAFEDVSIKYRKMRFYFYGDAVDVINECEKKHIRIYGFDSFRLFAQGIQPSMEFSPSYDSLEKSLTWDQARADLKKLSESDFVFEIAYERKGDDRRRRKFERRRAGWGIC